MAKVEVTKCIISGIKNPAIQIEGKMNQKEIILILKIDKKKQDYNINFDNDKFILTTEINPKDKIIELFYRASSKEIKIFTTKNSILKRIGNKIKSLFLTPYLYLKAIIVTLIKGIRFLWKEYHFLVPPKLWGKFWKDFKIRVHQRGVKFYYDPFVQKDYLKWLKEEEKTSEKKELTYQPLISVLIPVYNINQVFLSECIDSILNQTYQNFEICLVDDASKLQETKETLKAYEKKDTRIKVKYRAKNGHISRATNDCLKLANGEFVALVDNDDTLAENALYEVVKALNENKKLDFIYSDEDKLDLNGIRCNPHFKPDWSPDTLMSLNYICHLAVIRKSLVEEVNGFTVGLEGAQDHDLFLKVTEKTNRIHHIPKILYHWRMGEGSTSMTIKNKDYASDKGAIAIQNALERRGLSGSVQKDEKSGYYIVNYELKQQPKISIIIPTRDYSETLDTCLSSLFQKTTYKNYEVIVVNNNSKEKETFDLFARFKKKYKNFKVIDANMEFNYSKINNLAIKEAKGEYIVLLNNDTEIITPEWLDKMVGYASLSHIGAVGVKLLYPDTTVQHGGVILGLGGVASHAYIGTSREDLGMYGRLRVPYDYSAVTAACLMVKKEKFYEVDGLEENLSVAYNDIDFNLKLLKKGYNNIFLPQVELFHFESKSRGMDTTTEKYQRFLKESDYMYKKWPRVIKNDVFYNPNFSKKGWFVLYKKEGK